MTASAAEMERIDIFLITSKSANGHKTHYWHGFRRTLQACKEPGMVVCLALATSSRLTVHPGMSRSRPAFEDLTGDEAFETADDLHCAFAICFAFFDIIESRLVISHPDDYDSIQGSIGLPVAATVEAMSVRFPARGCREVRVWKSDRFPAFEGNG
jgi:hypothetical protein